MSGKWVVLEGNKGLLVQYEEKKTNKMQQLDVYY